MGRIYCHCREQPVCVLSSTVVAAAPQPVTISLASAYSLLKALRCDGSESPYAPAAGPTLKERLHELATVPLS